MKVGKTDWIAYFWAVANEVLLKWRHKLHYCEVLLSKVQITSETLLRLQKYYFIIVIIFIIIIIVNLDSQIDLISSLGSR